MATLHIIDTGRLDPDSHSRHRDAALIDAAQARGLRVRLLADRAAEPLAHPAAVHVPAFRRRWGHVGSPDGVDAAITAGLIGDAVERELHAALDGELAPGDVVLAHTLSAPALAGVLAWAQRAPQPGWTLRLLFYGPFDTKTGPAVGPLYETIAQSALAAVELPAGVRLELFSESDVLAAYLRSLSGRPVELAPPGIDFGAGAGDRQAPRNPPVLGQLGAPRAEKGGELIVDCARALIGAGPGCRLVLHSPRGASIEALPAELRESCQLIADPLDHASFLAWLESCSAILLPYDPQHYRRRNSSILLESLGRARPVVTTADSALGAYLQQFDPLPGSLMESFSRASLIAATEALLADLPGKLAAAQQAAETVRAQCDTAQVHARLTAPPAG